MYFSALAHPDTSSHLRHLFDVPALSGDRTGAPTLLLPIDASIASEHAVDYVARNLAGTAGRVHVLNVQQSDIDDPELLHALPALAAAQRKAGQRLTWKAALRLAAARIQHRSRVAFGHVAETIVREAEEQRCSLIVMGTRARHQAMELLAGSIPRRVIRMTPVPVLLVRHQPGRQG